MFLWGWSLKAAPTNVTAKIITMYNVTGPLIFLAVLFCTCVMSDDFLRIELNDRSEQPYSNDSADVQLEMDQENTKQPITKNSESSNRDVLNVIPTGLSDRAFQKYYQLRHKLKFRKLVGENDEEKAVGLPAESASGPTTTATTKRATSTTTETATTPTTTETIEEVTATTALYKKHEHEEDFPEIITDSMSHDYDIIVFMDKEQLEHEPILAPSGVGFFYGIVNLVKWLISLSAEIEVEDYEE